MLVGQTVEEMITSCLVEINVHVGGVGKRLREMHEFVGERVHVCECVCWGSQTVSNPHAPFSYDNVNAG